MGNDEGLIRIYTEGGIINDVLGLPDDARYKIVDYDDITHMEPCCGNCKHAEACKLGFGDTGCDYEHCRQKELEAEQLKRKILEGDALRILNKYRRDIIFSGIIQDFSDHGIEDFVKTDGKDYKFHVYKPS